MTIHSQLHRIEIFCSARNRAAPGFRREGWNVRWEEATRKYPLRTSSVWDQNCADQNRRDYANALPAILSGKKAPGQRCLSLYLKSYASNATIVLATMLNFTKIL